MDELLRVREDRTDILLVHRVEDEVCSDVRCHLAPGVPRPLGAILPLAFRVLDLTVVGPPQILQQLVVPTLELEADLQRFLFLYLGNPRQHLLLTHVPPLGLTFDVDPVPPGRQVWLKDAPLLTIHGLIIAWRRREKDLRDENERAMLEIDARRTSPRSR